ncbi:MAG: hypothetical protein HC888_00050 [Candidatus Competibacteraceae bacterium]|nr:hypothetical protein [Candidatus Competibacteraceae bacterium]
MATFTEADFSGYSSRQFNNMLVGNPYMSGGICYQDYAPQTFTCGGVTNLPQTIVAYYIAVDGRDESGVIGERLICSESIGPYVIDNTNDQIVLTLRMRVRRRP